MPRVKYAPALIVVAVAVAVLIVGGLYGGALDNLLGRGEEPFLSFIPGVSKE
ncbi:MAG: hypothetical protein ACE5JL_03185 [Dehalococcoidia bacterium]